MQARLLGFTGISVAFVAVLAALARAAGDPAAAAGTPVLLILALNAAAWGIGQAMGPRATLGRSLVLLGDALAPLAPCAALFLLAPDALRNPSVRLGALAAGLGIALALGALRSRGPLGDDPYPYFLAFWTGLVLALGRPLAGFGPGTLLFLSVALAALLRYAVLSRAGEGGEEVAQAAMALLSAAVLSAALFFGLTPGPGLLAGSYAAALLLLFWAAQAAELGPGSRLFGAGAYLALTVSLTETLRFFGVALPVYLVAVVTWALVLVALGIVADSASAEPFRESAHWVAALLAASLALFTAPVWGPELRLPAIGRSLVGPAPALLEAAATLGVALVLGGLAVRRKRHPPIASSVFGFASNLGLTAAASYAAPSLVVLAGSACLALLLPGSGRILAPLAFSALLLFATGEPERRLGKAPLALAGYGALVLAIARSRHAPETAVPALAFAASILLGRSIRTGARLPYVLFLLALAAIPRQLAPGGGEVLGTALMGLVAIAVGRAFQSLEGPEPRGLLASGFGVALGAWAFRESLLRAPFALPTLLLLFLGIPLAFYGAPERGRAWDRGVVVRGWIEMIGHLLAFGSGAALVVLLWHALGFPLRDSGPVLAAWALLYRSVHAAFGARRPGRPSTHAALAASYALSAASLALVLVSTSRAIAGATLLLDGAFAFSWAFPKSRASRALELLGHALVILGAGLGLASSPDLGTLLLVGASFVYLWRSLREGRLAPHAVFLLVLTAATLYAIVTGVLPEAVPALGLLAVGLVIVEELAASFEGRGSKVRLTLAWAALAGFATLLVDLFGTSRSEWTLWPVAIAFLVAGARLDDGGAEDRARPGEPEDLWLSTSAYWLAHWAGAAWLVSALVSSELSLGWAPVLLAAWAGIDLALALGRSDRIVAKAAAQAGHALAGAALVLAFLVGRDGGPPVLACVLVGFLYAILAARKVAPLFALASAGAFVLAYSLLGLSSGIRLPEYYLAGALALLYIALRLQGDDDLLLDSGRWLLSGPAAWARRARTAILPLAILVAGALYPAWALLRSGQEIHLFFLAGAAVLLPYAFFRAGHGTTYAVPLSALLLLGALYLYARGELGPGASLALVAASPLVLLNLLAFEVGPFGLAGRSLGAEAAVERVPTSSV
jgi:hypothetical protein